MKLKNPSQLFEAGPWQQFLVYGVSGCGKSTWAAMSPRPVIISTEPKGRSAIANGVNSSGNRESALMVEPENWQELKDTIRTLAKGVVIEHEGQPAMKIVDDGDEHIIQTVVLDSLTQLSKMAKEHYTKDKQKGTTKPEWGKVIEAIAGLLDYIGKLPCNFILTAHTQNIQDGDDLKKVPAVFGKNLPDQIGSFFSATAYMAVGKGKRVLYWTRESTASKPPVSAAGFPSHTICGPVGSGIGTPGAIALELAKQDGIARPHNENDIAISDEQKSEEN